MEAFCSLYVGDLDPFVTEDQLIETFSKLEGYASAMLCSDSITGRSLCYGFVNFLGNQQAMHAIETMNHKSINGKAIRLTWSQRNSEARKSGIGNIFVKNLDISIDNSKLHDIFTKYGNILSCKVAMSPEGKSNCYGFVQFESEESANNAIQTVHGSIIYGKEIHVSRFITKSERIKADSGATYTNLFIKNLDSDVTSDLLHEKFSGFGEITSLIISKDENGVSKGFGFVNFANSDDAKRAEESMHGTQLGLKAIYVARAQTKAERQRILSLEFEQRHERLQKYKGLNVYIKHIHDNVDDLQLKDYFSLCGTVTSAKIMRDEKGASKGFGFVCFSTCDEATTAINTLNGIKFHGKPLYVAIAQSKAARKTFFQTLYARHSAGFLGHFTANTAPIYHNFGHQLPWRPNGFSTPMGPGVPGFQAPPFPMQYRERLNNHIIPSYIGAGGGYPPFPQQHNQFVHLHRKSAYQQRAGNAKHWSNGLPKLTMSNGETVPSVFDSSSTKAPKESEDLSTKLAAASAEDRKEMLGQHLYPLVQKLQSDLATKITGMLLEMDNAELLLLLESPDSLAAKAEEAIQVLELQQNKAYEGGADTKAETQSSEASSKQ